MSKRKDVLIIAGVLVAAACLFVVRSALQGRTLDISELTAQTTPAGEEEMEAFGPSLPQNEEPVAGYVVIGVNGKQYGDPIPMDREKIITIKQDDDHINQVRITRESVEMLSSTCENHDCVLQGAITPENYQTRILSTFILCLPNEVSIEFIPASSAQEE